jgi:hypothetical protein
MDHILIYCNFLKDGKCELGLHGGFPHAGNCTACINANENNEEYAKMLFSNYEKSHPSDKPKVSGCCDSAKNYID